MNGFRPLILIILATLSLPVSAGMYKWVDESGRVHFGDQPPPEAKTEEVGGTINGYSSDGAVRDSCAGKSGGGRVTMYSAEWCGVCKEASAWMKSNNIPFVERDIDKSPRARRQWKNVGGKGVPVIVVNDQAMQGFSPGRLQAMLGSPSSSASGTSGNCK